MKTKLQIAKELHDEWLKQLVSSECEVRFSLLSENNREQKEAVLFRDNMATRIALLEKYMKEVE
jgi:hypothetical protein